MAELLTPGRLADLVDSNEFKALPFDQRSKVFESGVAEAHDHVAQTSGWTPELWKGFGDAVNKRRGEITDSETVMEKTGYAAKALGRFAADSVKTIGAGGLGVSPVLPDGKPGAGVTGQVPGQTLVPMLGQNLARIDQSIAGKLAGKQELVTKPLDELKARIDAADFPLNDAKAFSSWLDEQNGKLTEAAKGYYEHRQGYGQEGVPEDVRKQRLDAVEPWVKGNDLSRPENASALARYLKTRSASAWDELRQNLLTTPEEAGIDKERTRLSTETPLGRALKPEVQNYIQEAADPMELAGTAFGVIKGATAAAKGLSKLSRVAEVAKGAAGEVLSEQGSLLMDSPNASPEQRWQVAKDSLIGALGLAGAGAAGSKISERLAGGQPTPSTQPLPKTAGETSGTLPPPAPSGSPQAPPVSSMPTAPIGGSQTVDLKSPSSVEAPAPAVEGQPLSSVPTYEAPSEVSNPVGTPSAPQVEPVATQPLPAMPPGEVPVLPSAATVEESSVVAPEISASVPGAPADATSMGTAGEAQVTEGSIPSTGAIDSTAPVAQTAANAPAPIQPVETVSEPTAGRGGPGASSVEEWGMSRFGQRISKAAPEMKGAWAQEFKPVQYRKRTEIEWEQDSKRFVQSQGLGAADLVFDPDSGLEGSDRVALAGVLLDEADRAESAGSKDAGELARDLADWLSLNGSKAGQEVRAYGFLVKRDPRLIVEQFRKKRNQELEDSAKKDLGVALPSVEAEVKNVVTAEREAAAVDVERRIEGSAPAMKAARDIESRAQREIDRMARQMSDTPPPTVAQRVDEFRKLMSEALRGEDMVATGEFQTRLEALGATPATAAQLGKLVDLGRKNAAEVAREKAGQRLIESLTPSATKQGKAKLIPLIDKLLTAEEKGVLGRTEFLEAYAQAFELPIITPEVQKRLTDLAREVRAMPEGLPRLEKAHELQNELAVFGGVKARDALMGAWYANLLSGLSTQAVNVVGNLWHLTMRGGAAMIASPKDALAFSRGILRGFERGRLEARNALSGGQAFKGVDKLGGVNALEALAKIPFDERSGGQKLATLISGGPLGRIVFRGLAAFDGLFHGVAAEGRAHLAASRAVRAQGLKVGSPAYWNAIADDLGLGAGKWADAYQQALLESKDLKKSADWAKRRAWDIIDRGRDLALREESQRWSDIVTYQNNPQGSTGWAFDVLTKLQDFMLLDRVPVFRPIVPFARVLANVMSSNMDMTPIGILRWWRGKQLTGKSEVLEAWDQRERLAMGMMGSMALTTLGALAFRGKDENDKDVGFMIYGAGPPDKNARAQMPRGWKPYSIKWGDKYISYAETPMGLGLGAVGAAMDSVRYTKDFDEKGLDDRLGYLFGAMSGSIFSQGMLSSAGNLLDTLKGDRKIETLAANVVGGFIPGQGLLRDVTSLFDPTKISATDIQSALLRDIPVIRRMAGRPDLNIWGDPVKVEGLPVVKRFIVGQRADDLSDWVTVNRLKVPAVPQNVEWASYLTEGEKTFQKANRVEAGLLTPKERYEFVQRSGSMMKDRVTSFKREVESAKLRGDTVPKEVMQRRIDAIARVARGEAMRALVNK